MRLVFCGTPRFAVYTLEALLAGGHSVELVLTQPDRPSGRGMAVQESAIKRRAGELGLPLAQPEKIRNNPKLQERLTGIAPDAIIVVAYGRLIPPWMLELPRFGNLNLHASLLPKYRGAAPIQWAVANGETETGVTAMRLDEGLDTGDILLQERVPIAMHENAVELGNTLARLGGDLMLRALAGLEAGTIHATAQENGRASLAPLLKRTDGHIDWSRPAKAIYDRWRGFQPWPGAFAQFRGRMMILHAVLPTDLHSSVLLPGMLRVQAGRLLATCGEGTQLEILELQIEGKRRLDVAAFLHGVTLAPGERLA